MSRSRLRAWLAAAVTSALTMTLLTTGSAIPAHADEATCSRSGCVSVVANLAGLPAVGETTTLTFDITAEFERPDVQINADLPIGLEWAQPPAGMEVRAVPSLLPADRGRLNRATGTVSFAAGETRRFEGRVVAVAAGLADIAVRVLAPVGEESETQVDHVYLTVAERGGTSSRGFATGPDRTMVAGPPGAIASPAHPVYKPARFQAAPASMAAPLAGTACVAGQWGYVDNLNVTRVSPNYTVEVWDKDFVDPGTADDDLLATVLTDENGVYSVCFDNDDMEAFIHDAGQDVYTRMVSKNPAWRVQDPDTGDLYTFVHPVVLDLPDSTPDLPHDFEFEDPADPFDHIGLQAFDAINDLWSWIPGDCWDDEDAVCGQLVVNWRADFEHVNGNHYDPNIRQVILEGDGPNDNDTTVHEGAHAVMDDVYEFVDVPGSGGNHEINKVSTPGTAWEEGFAEWMATQVYFDPIYHGVNLETRKWGTPGWANGASVEGRVAGALLDLADAGNETPWDRISLGAPGLIWVTLLKHKSNTFHQFWTQFVADHFANVEPINGLSTLYQNTIDFVFRDPLANNTPVIRPTPFAPHNFSYNTTTQFWSVVALRSPAGGNYDLRLFDDKPLNTHIISSNAPGTAIDFVAVNSNALKQPLGDYYPRVNGTSGTGNGVLELSQGSLSLVPASSQSISMTGSKLVAVRDTTLAANIPVTIKVIPTLAAQDAELFILNPTPNVGELKNFRARLSTSNKVGAAFGPGGTETVTFTPTVSGRYGVVVINKAGSGSYTLQRT